MKMKSHWLAASSFEESLKLVAAINDISAHAKLALAKIDDPTPAEQVEASRKILADFLERFRAVAQSVEADETRPILGTDPRSGKLVKKYLAHKENQLKPSGLYNISLERLRELVQSDKPEGLRELIDCLRDLRELVEEHSQADVNSILGEI
jgi:hypothetical protein